MDLGKIGKMGLGNLGSGILGNHKKGGIGVYRVSNADTPWTWMAAGFD